MEAEISKEMTYEEIIESARTIDGLIKVYGFKGKNLEALVRAKFALEKQIPKKPKGNHNLCPNCESVEFGYNIPKFCDCCGQAIWYADWSEE